MIANSKWISPGVVDASVAAKWLIPEQRSIDADRLLESILGSPDLTVRHRFPTTTPPNGPWESSDD